MATRRPITVAELASKAKAQPKATPGRAREKRKPARGGARQSASSAYHFVSDAYARQDRRGRGGNGNRARRPRLHLIRTLKELARTLQALLNALKRLVPWAFATA